jgi:hypothetical protein
LVTQVLWLCAVQGGLRIKAQILTILLQTMERLFDVGLAIALVRPQGDVGV